VTLVLDASVVIAWHLTRSDKHEALLAQQALQLAMAQGATVPFLLFPEVANALLIAERQQLSTAKASATFLADFDTLPITLDSVSPRTAQTQVIAQARAYQLTAYDAIYFELARRKRASLATFDRKLAEAFRKAGGQVFGDPI
jgi:predicted nucleic acid-binding protein